MVSIICNAVAAARTIEVALSRVVENAWEDYFARDCNVTCSDLSVASYRAAPYDGPKRCSESKFECSHDVTM